MNSETTDAILDHLWDELQDNAFQQDQVTQEIEETKKFLAMLEKKLHDLKDTNFQLTRTQCIVVTKKYNSP